MLMALQAGLPILDYSDWDWEKREAYFAAVKQTLEKKKRLGQYAVIWHDGKPVITGDDAPENADRAE